MLSTTLEISASFSIDEYPKYPDTARVATISPNPIPIFCLNLNLFIHFSSDRLPRYGSTCPRVHRPPPLFRRFLSRRGMQYHRSHQRGRTVNWKPPSIRLSPQIPG